MLQCGATIGQEDTERQAAIAREAVRLRQAFAAYSSGLPVGQGVTGWVAWAGWQGRFGEVGWVRGAGGLRMAGVVGIGGVVARAPL